MPYSFAAFEHLADVGRAPSPAAGAPAGLLPHATTLLSARPAGPGACPTNGLRLSSLSKTIWHCASACRCGLQPTVRAARAEARAGTLKRAPPSPGVANLDPPAAQRIADFNAV